MEYDEFLLCYIVLVLGRFIFFDSTINEFKKSLGDLNEYVIPLIIAFILTGIISLIGLYLKVITTDNLFISLIMCHIAMLFFIYIMKKIIHDIGGFVYMYTLRKYIIVYMCDDTLKFVEAYCIAM